MLPMRLLLRPLVVPALAGLLAGCSEGSTAPTTGGPDLSVLLNREAAQMDRFGLPAIATVFIPTSQKDAYNTAVPSGDRAMFRHFVFDKLVEFGNSTAAANALADFVQPDIQPVDLSQPTAFPNGRRPQDDVITAELGLIFGSNAALNDDHVDANDKAFLAAFPYLADPWTE
jgi:hypothetical protein